MNKKLTVTIGISAYNEENNISELLKSIVAQDNKNWVLSEIIIYSDGSTDNTVNLIREQKIKKLKIINSIKRTGKSSGLNIIFRTFNSDILVLIDADVTIKDSNAVSKLIQSFYKYPDVDLIGGKPMPFKPENFVQQAIYSTYLVYDDSRNNINRGNNIYSCSGQFLALRRVLAKDIQIPKYIVNDDDYIYFSCLAKKRKFYYENNAVVYYKMPSTIRDYLKQLYRSSPEAVEINMRKHFKELVRSEYKRPLKFYTRSVFKAFTTQPLPTSLIIFTNMITKPYIPLILKKSKQRWFIAKSTKQIN